MGRAVGCIVAAILAVAGVARADDASPASDKSAYTLFNPTPQSQLRSLCTDRPSKSNAPCSVDAGHWQIESDVYNVTIQHDGGATTTTELFTNPNVKLGVTNALDLEFSVSPYERVTVKDHGVTTRASGPGDLFLLAKYNLAGNDGGDFALALNPYVKLPTASRKIGNGAVEEGLIVPAQLNLRGGWQLSVAPEVDRLQNASGDGYHANLINLLGLGRPVSKTVTISGEIWMDNNFDPAGTVTQLSADISAAWIPAAEPNLQFDCGVNVGLNRVTPAVQLYFGISKRF